MSFLSSLSQQRTRLDNDFPGSSILKENIIVTVVIDGIESKATFITAALEGQYLVELNENKVQVIVDETQIKK